MKKTLLIATASALSLSISSVVAAGEIETAERYAAPLEAQNVVEMDVTAVTEQQEIPMQGSLGNESPSLEWLRPSEVKSLGYNTKKPQIRTYPA
jgi:hypothetical protein